MQKEEERLKAEISALFAQADAIDRQEDELYGVGKAGDELPAELALRERRLERIRAAKAELEREAAAARAEQLRANASGQRLRAEDGDIDSVERKRSLSRAQKSERQADRLGGGGDDDDSGGACGGGLPQGRVGAKSDGTPKPLAQRHFTDGQSRIMVSGGAVLQAYNAQVVVDAHAQVVVAEAVTNQGGDAPHLPVMIQRMRCNLGRLPKRLSADSGYFSAANANVCQAAGVDAYLATGRLKHRHDHAIAPRWPAHETMCAKLSTPQGRAIYARRKVIVEPAFGQIKHGRGFRRFSLRGLDKVRCEWSLVCWTHNLLKLFRHGWRAPHPPSSSSCAQHTPQTTHRVHKLAQLGSRT